MNRLIAAFVAATFLTACGSSTTPVKGSGRVVQGKIVDEVSEPLRFAATPKEFDCLARNIFYEAGIESFRGKIAVAQVTANRIGMRKNWDSICKVVYAKAQFSWTLDPKLRYKKPHGPLWEESQKAALAFVMGERIPALENSDHYYATYIQSPVWSKKMRRVKKIGRHVFYTQKKVK